MSVRAIDTEPLSPPPEAAIAPRRKLVGRRLDDEQLASRIADGNELAFTALYERYHQPLYRYCRSLLHNDADAQDALQSAFTSALVALKANRRDAPLRPWLFRIAHNEAISLVRRRRSGDQELSESVLPAVQSAADQAGERARLALLVADLNHLPDRQRGALVMRELSGLSHTEIALTLGTSPAAAKQAIFEARTALSEFAEGRAASCEEIRRRLSEHDGRVMRNRRLRSHLRDCSSCGAFAAAIGQRHSDLRAIAPALPVVASVGLLVRIARGGDQGLSGLAASGAAAGAAGKFGGAALISKSLATIAAGLTSVAGVAGLSSTLHAAHHAPLRPQAPAVSHAAGPAASPATRSAAPSSTASSPARSRARVHPSRTHRAAGKAHTAATATPAPRQTNTSAAPVHQAPTEPSRPFAGKRSASQTWSSTQPSRAGRTKNPTSSASPAPIIHSTSPGHSSAAPGHGGTSPGNSGSSHGASSVAPGHAGGTPGHGATPPGHGGAPPGKTITAPRLPAVTRVRNDAVPARPAVTASHGNAAPGHAAAAPGHTGVAPGQGGTAPSQAPVRGDTPPGQAKK